jgi:hypothetical protein
MLLFCRELNGWLDKVDVRKALHAASEKVTGRFQECTTRINYTHNTGNSMVSTHLLLNIKGALIHGTYTCSDCSDTHPSPQFVKNVRGTLPVNRLTGRSRNNVKE